MALHKPVQVFRIRFKNWAKSYVLNKPLHHSQRVIVEKTDEVVVEIKVRPGVELDFQLSRFPVFGSSMRFYSRSVEKKLVVLSS
jgi:hypothetical protein